MTASTKSTESDTQTCPLCGVITPDPKKTFTASQNHDGVGEMPGFLFGIPQLVTPRMGTTTLEPKKPFTTSRSKDGWETVNETIPADRNSQRFVKRLKVIGGWLIETAVNIYDQVFLTTVFVPDANHEWKIED